jgi:hypothetical protein
MAERKTRATSDDVAAFVTAVPDEGRRDDTEAALALISSVTGAEPVMWGSAIVGFGHSTYATADGKQHDWFAVGLSPRKAALTFYGLGVADDPEGLLARLGKHTTGKGCLYLKRLSDVDTTVLEELVRRAWEGKDQSGSAG